MLSTAHAPAEAEEASHDAGDLLPALQRLGHSRFRPGQEEIIRAVLSGQDAIAVMPTGGGKSLCFQLPALLLPGVTLVVSPLIALMRDQVAALQARGIAATYINSTLTPAERQERQQELHRYHLVYVAPERFRSPQFCAAIAQVPIALLAVDEAHCISEWGHDFRPDYRRLGEVVQRLRPPRLLALTATATEEVRQDIAAQLHLREPQVVVHGFDRPSLHLSVERAGGDQDKLGRALRLLRSTTSGVAIVYAATRKKAEAVAHGLRASGLRARPYHAGLTDEERHDTERAFLSGELPIIVATNAFGMGIDKRDVRLVLHHDLPRSPEAYYQEAGRAGRDGRPARCVLLFNAGDARVQEYLIDQSVPSPLAFRQVYALIQHHGPIDDQRLAQELPGVNETMLRVVLRALERGGAIAEEPGAGYGVVGPLRWDERGLQLRLEHERRKLRRMTSYGYHVGCRMRFLLEYFGDRELSGPGQGCGRCDSCQTRGTPLSDQDQLVVRKALSAVARLDGRFGKRRLAEVLLGQRTEEVERAGLDRLSTFGLLADRTLPWLVDLLGALEAAGLVISSATEYPTLSLTPLGREVMHDRVRAQLALPAERAPRPRGGKAAPAPATAPLAPAPAPAPDPAAEARFERLRKLRLELARQAGQSPFIIFHDRTLRAIAAAFPRSKEELAQVPGVGPAKLEKYGDQVLAALRE